MVLRNNPASSLLASPCPALRYSLIYAAISSLWIFSSDQILGLVANEPDYLTRLQSYKGLLFIAASALLLFFLLKRAYTVGNGTGRLELAKRYEILVKHANDCIIISDDQHRIIDVNKRCHATYGYSSEEMLAMTDDCLLPGETDSLRPDPAAASSDPLLYEALHRRKDGSIFPVEISETIIDVDGRKQKHRIVRDITERKAQQAHIAQLSRLSLTLSTVNHAIAHSASLDEVYAVTCRAFVDNAGFKLAWIGLVAPEKDALRIACHWGEADGLPEQPDLAIAPDAAHEDSPGVLAFREQRIVLAGDALALPIVPIGVLTAYGERANAFGRDAECLLGEIGNALSFAVHHFAEQTAREEAEKALKLSEEQLLRAEEIAGLGHWEVNLENGRKIWSPQIYRLFGRDPALGPAEPAVVYSQYFTPDSARITKQGIREAIASGQRIHLEQELHLPGERTAYHATVIVPIRDDQGKTVALHGTVQDVTEHKLTESRLAKMASRLAQSAREYEDLYQNAPCGYHSLDKDGVFQRINKTELQWLGYSRSEVIGKMKFSDLLPPERVADFHNDFQHLVQTGELRDQELTLRCKDGSLLPVLINATIIRNEAGQFLISRSTAFDMTERKKIEKEREQYTQRLNLLSRRLVDMQEAERRRLSASLHDRTSPNLAAIGLNLSILDRPGAPPLPPELVERLADIRALLDDTTASIREISADLRPPLLDYAGLRPTLESYLHQFAKRTGIVTRFDCPDFTTRPPPDQEALLFRIAQEALTNIAKHAEASSVDVVLENDDGRIRLTIRDNGAGFDPDTLGSNGAPVGLGMLNMREMTEFAGGRFTIVSSPAHGTEIRVEI